jgi:GntR family transcriptional regulator
LQRVPPAETGAIEAAAFTLGRTGIGSTESRCCGLCGTCRGATQPVKHMQRGTGKVGIFHWRRQTLCEHLQNRDVSGKLSGHIFIIARTENNVSSLPKHRYRQIADKLRTDIERGKYAVGSLLPTEQQLCEFHGISRHTAREALRVLLNDRMVARRQGSGTIVTASTRQRFNHSISSVSDLLQYGANTRLRILDTHRIQADEEIAALLGCEPGTECVHLHGLRSESKGAAPFCISDIYRVAGRDSLTRRLLEVRGAVYALIDELDIGHIGSVEQSINAGTLSPDDAEELGVGKRSVCLRIVRRYCDPQGKLILVAVNQHPGSEFEYSMSLKQSV